MIAQLAGEFERHGQQGRVVPVERLGDLRAELDEFGRTEPLNGFQRYIISEMYHLELPELHFPVRSVIVAASPVPAYARVVFEWQGERIPLTSLAHAFPGRPEPSAEIANYLGAVLAPAGYHLAPAETLPLKRLAARSGLATYGRNNICYVPGMGSFMNLYAFYSDLPADAQVTGDVLAGGWHDIGPMAACDGCDACLDACPTGAIRPQRFLIDNERCLSCYNEGPGEFPDWLPRSVHHCLYDCLRCQLACPENAAYAGRVIGPIDFDSDETALLLAGKPLDEFPAALQDKVRLLGMDPCLAAIPRNLALLLETRTRV